MYRYPAVAGSFYPDDSGQLSQMLSEYILRLESAEKVPKAMIVPHAGYIYSGQIAASAYARLKTAAATINRVVLLGPSHRVAFHGLALSHAQAFKTPLGDVLIDDKGYQAITHLGFVHFNDQAHEYEHSLEVQLPFLQMLLKNFKLVPIVVGEASAEQVSQVIELLWGGPETLIVVSSDLSHYHDYGTAQILDHNTSKFIENLDYQHISYDAACGKTPICGLLKYLKSKSLQIKTIDLRNSADTASRDKNRVVGYGAYVVD